MKDTIRYREEDNYLIPNLHKETLPQIGKYGRMRLQFLEEPEQQAKYVLLLMKGKLNQDLIETERLANERVETYMKELMEKQEAPDKNAYPLEWTGYMNNLKHQAEELVYPEVIYR